MKKRTDKELQEAIDKFNEGKNWWYQPIVFKDGVMTHSKKRSDKDFYSKRTFGINKWNNFVVPFLPFDLKDKVILDIGCNAGVFLIQAIKAGAKFAYGIEPSLFDTGFYDQCMFVIDTFSEVEDFDYHSKIKVVNNEAHKVDWDNDFAYKLDITFAYNVLYWLTFSDEKGSLPNATEIMKDVLNNIAQTSEYLLILGDEGVQKRREKKGELANICAGIETTIPFLTEFDIEYTWIEKPPLERNPSLIIARSKYFE